MLKIVLKNITVCLFVFLSSKVHANSNCSPYAEIARAHFQNESVVRFTQWRNELNLTVAQINTQVCNEKKLQVSLEKYHKLQESIASGYPIVFFVVKDGAPGGAICLFDFLTLNEFKQEELEILQNSKPSCMDSADLTHVRFIRKNLNVYIPNDVLDLATVRGPSSLVKKENTKEKKRKKDVKK